MAWDGFQREVLAALGHQVYALATAAPALPQARDAGHAPRAPATSSPLQRALARAAGVELSALPPLPPPDVLHSPAAKRALWPRLRALRAGRPRG